MGSINSTPVIILFDTGASHSFISETCRLNLELNSEETSESMSVATPSGEAMNTRRMCLNLELTLGSLVLPIDRLYVLRMWDVDVILGMDWLVANHATIRCRERRISF